MSDPVSPRGVDREHARQGFGSVLRRHRLAHKLSREELGDRAGVSAGYVAKLENSSILPRPDLLARLAHAVGVEAADLTAEATAAGATAAGATAAGAAPHTPPRRAATLFDAADDTHPAACEHPGWLYGIEEAINTLPPEQRQTLGRHVMFHTQRLIDARLPHTTETLDTLDEILRSLIPRLNASNPQALQRAWDLILAVLAEHPDDEEQTLRDVLDAAYETTTGRRFTNR